MYLYFLSGDNGLLFYLTPKKQYTAGRKDCDIVIGDSKYISRKHAIFTIEGSTVSIVDSGSTYGLTVNNKKITPNKSMIIGQGDEIKFGVYECIFRLEAVKLVTTSSGLNKSEKEKLAKALTFLSGNLIHNWDNNCTYITVKEIVLTVKILCAIVQGIPIVTPTFWDDCMENVKNHLNLPHHENYLPPINENTLKNFSLAYKSERKTIFKGKTFIFPSSSAKLKMEEIVIIAGGEAIVWDEKIISKENLLNDFDNKYIVVQDDGVVVKESNSQSFKNAVNALCNDGKRPIPVQEIALAIIHCSIEKNCNPIFNRAKALLTNQTQFASSENVLAYSTEPLNSFCPKTEIKEEIIPQTLEENNSMIENKTLNIESSCMLELEENVANTSKNIKRKADSSQDVIKSWFKKSKQSMESVPLNTLIENDFKPSTPKTTLEINSSVQVSKDNPFARKRKIQDDSTVQQTSMSKKNKLINPLAIKDQRTLQESPFITTNSSNINKLHDNKKSSNQNIFSEEPKRSFIVDEERPSTSSKTTNFNHNVISSSLCKFIESENSSDISDTAVEKSEWIDTTVIKKSNLNNRSNINEEFDPDMSKFIDSFKNAIVVENKPLEVLMRSDHTTNISTLVFTGNVKNVKKFRKRLPLRPQTSTVPMSDCVKVLCALNRSVC